MLWKPGVSSYADERTINDSLASGMDDFLPKPFTMSGLNTLNKMIDNRAEIRQKREELSDSAHPSVLAQSPNKSSVEFLPVGNEHASVGDLDPGVSNRGTYQAQENHVNIQISPANNRGKASVVELETKKQESGSCCIIV